MQHTFREDVSDYAHWLVWHTRSVAACVAQTQALYQMHGSAEDRVTYARKTLDALVLSGGYHRQSASIMSYSLGRGGVSPREALWLRPRTLTFPSVRTLLRMQPEDCVRSCPMNRSVEPH